MIQIKIDFKVRNRNFLPRTLKWESVIYHLIKLIFDVEVSEKFLNGT